MADLDYWPTTTHCYGCEAETTHAEADGWLIGHDNGQGYYVCPGCPDAVWDALPLSPIPKRKTEPYAD